MAEVRGEVALRDGAVLEEGGVSVRPSFEWGSCLSGPGGAHAALRARSTTSQWPTFHWCYTAHLFRTKCLRVFRSDQPPHKEPLLVFNLCN